MKPTSLACCALLVLSGCIRSPYPAPVPVGDDKSIRFPDFREQPPVQVGGQPGPYELDGVLLRALWIAANDFAPPRPEPQDCPLRQEAQRYRVIRQGDIIFVEVDFDPAACGFKLFALDGGARYAISSDGRILRRLVGLEPDRQVPSEAPGRAVPVPDSEVGKSQLQVDAPSPALDGGVNPADGGMPGEPPH